MRTPEIDFLWWEGCPSTEPALAELRVALDELGLADSELRIQEIETVAAAEATGFLGSPTILIDGADLVSIIAGDDPNAIAEPAGLHCRLYRRRDGRISPLPDPDDLREALRRAAARDEVTP